MAKQKRLKEDKETLEQKLWKTADTLRKNIESPGIFSHHLYKLNFKNAILPKEFVYYLLKSGMGREQLVGATNGRTVNMLDKKGLEKLQFSLPSSIKIKVFSESVSSFRNKKEKNYIQINVLTKL